MYVPEIIEVKDELEAIKKKGLIKDWELPYENLLTRRDAAIFFVEPVDNEADIETVWETLRKFEDFNFQSNEEAKLSKMKYEVTFVRKDD